MSKTAPVLLLDGHVHIYACFDTARLFDSAWTALHQRATALGLPSWQGVLLMTESRRDAAFEALATGTTTVGGWTVSPTEEPETLLLEGGQGRRLWLVSGFQVATVEDLEVLAIGTRARVADGQEFFQSVGAVRAAGAFPVVPWGFGKWSFARGQIIRRLIESDSPTQLAFGDNGGRLSGLPMPSLLRLARERGYNIIPGTDPLPFPQQCARVGSSGLALSAGSTALPVAARVRAGLGAAGGPESGFISLTSPFAFVSAQVRMQILKRMR